MTDDRRTAPLAGFADAFAAAASDAVRIVERPFLAQVGVRVFGARSGAPDPAGLSAAEAALGFPLPAEPNTVAGAGGTRRAVARSRRVARGLGARQRGGARGRAGRGARRARLGRRPVRQPHCSPAAGPRARDVLAKGCALDLHPRAFGTGRCAQTLLGRARSILEQLADEPLTYGMLVRNSFAAYVATGCSTPRRSLLGARERRPAPALRPRHLVERVEVEAGDPGAGSAASGASPRSSASGRNWRVISRWSQLRWWRGSGRTGRARSSSRSARASRSRRAPGRPIQIGRWVPRRRTSRTQAPITSASKQIWLMMHVAIGAFANIAWIVSSSEIRWWLSG